MLVVKFGGTSMGGVQCFEKVKQIIARTAGEGVPVVVVVSAMSTVTDTLLDTARLAAQGNQSAVEEKLQYLERLHFQAVEEIFPQPHRQKAQKTVTEILGEFAKLSAGMALVAEMPLRALDAGLSVGERLSSMLLAWYLETCRIQAQAVDTAQCMITDDGFGSARPLLKHTQEAMRRILLPLAENKCIPIVTGFLGATREGLRTTLGRGGSDYSAAIVASSLNAKELWICTDVDGVFSADPKMVGEALILDELTYEEAAELSYFGAKVLHPKTLAPLQSSRIPVYIKNTYAPEKPGTRIGPSHKSSQQGAKAVTSRAPVALLTLRSNGTPGTTELLARTFAALSHSHVEILMVTQSSYQDSFCLLVPQSMAEMAQATLEHAFRLELSHHYLDPLDRQDVAAIALIGEGMKGTPGIAARLFGALAREKVSVIAIGQGSSESNISLVVSQENRIGAVRAIHQEFIVPAAARHA